MDRKFIPLLVTAVVLIALFVTACLMYPGFGSMRVVANLFSDNAVLGVVAVGMTFVILSGGIDLSVGSVVAFTTVLIATMMRRGMPPLAAMAVALVLGAAFGLGQGMLIQRYELPAFLVTLGGMFLARGLAFAVNRESVGIAHPVYARLQEMSLPLGGRASLPAVAVIFLSVFAGAWVIAHLTVFGRNIYALGGSLESARLMGLPVGRTRPAVYAVSGLCSALAGIVATIYTSSGNPVTGAGLELDAIAAVVIGGTLLTGGVGYLVGTLLGVLIFGTIQSALVFDGRLNSWWLRIAVGTLLLAFILLQRAFSQERSAHRAG
jgi:simple sugar transport system permease protein